MFPTVHCCVGSAQTSGLSRKLALNFANCFLRTKDSPHPCGWTWSRTMRSISELFPKPAVIWQPAEWQSLFYVAGLLKALEDTLEEKRRFYWCITVRTKQGRTEAKYLSGERSSQSQNNLSGTTNHVKHWHNARVPAVMLDAATQQMHLPVFSALWSSSSMYELHPQPVPCSQPCTCFPTVKQRLKAQHPYAETGDCGLKVRKTVGGSQSGDGCDLYNSVAYF